MNYIQQITLALDKEVENIAFLAYFPEQKLDKKLLRLKQQLDVAGKNKMSEAVELLKLWEQQVLDAKVLKEELHIEDNPALELNMFLPEIDAFEMIEKRQSQLRKKLLKD